MGHPGHLFISYFDMLGMSLLFPHSVDLDKLSQACKANSFSVQLSLKEFNEKLISKHKIYYFGIYFFKLCVRMCFYSVSCELFIF